MNSMEGLFNFLAECYNNPLFVGLGGIGAILIVTFILIILSIVIAFISYLMLKLIYWIYCKIVYSLARRVVKALVEFLSSKLGSKMEGSSVYLLTSLMMTAFKIIFVIYIFNIFGFKVTSIASAFLLSLGFIFKNDLESIFSGVISSIAGKLEIGSDIEIAGYKGKVTSVGLIHTIILSEKGEILIPNNLFSKEVLTKSGGKA